MHKHPQLTEARLRAALQRIIRPMIHRRTAPVTVTRWEVGGEPVPYAHAIEQDFQPIRPGERWGAAWDTTWFRITGELPADWAGEDEVCLSMDLGPDPTWCEGISCEGLAWHAGTPIAAVNLYRDQVFAFKDVQGGEAFEVYVEAAANIRPENVADGSWHVPADPGGEKRFTLKRCALRTFDREAWRFSIAFELMLDLLAELPKDTPRRGKLLAGLNHAVNLLDGGHPGKIAEAHDALRPLLESRNGDSAHRVSAVGHAHIDTAWLWPLRETIRKCARTFTSALNYMEQYPEYRFACSQPIQAAWMRDHYPEVFDRIKAAAQRGQWLPIGGMWVEADCNIPSGESLVRQFLHGQRFFRETFGAETSELWLPDVFGYSANLPQIMAGCGVDSFLTQKISWNQFNAFPHHSFDWQGIDGTSVFTHFPPSDTYTGTMRPNELSASVTRFRDHDRASRSLYPFGHGDGGGGPTLEMIESARLMRDLEGLPRVTIEPVQDFFDQAKADSVDRPTWVGELYLEYHRGTYTTQAKVKRANRRCERLLRDAELFDALCWIADGPVGSERVVAGFDPPAMAVYETCDTPETVEPNTHAALLDRAWKLLLLNQFHDIIPGSSIAWVYEDAERDYGVIESLVEAVTDHALGRVVATRKGGRDPQPTTLINTLGHDRREVIEVPGTGPRCVRVPACGYRLLEDAAGEPAQSVTADEQGGTIVLNNGLLTVSIDRRTGELTSVIDERHAGREVLATMPGDDAPRGNVLQLHHDRPIKWDAWDIDPYTSETAERIDTLDSIAVIEAGPLRGVVEIVRRFGRSRLTQRIVLTASSARIDFETEVDWQERHRLLKAAFPVDVRSEQASYEVQFGHVQRPTHFNTSWDLARFEVCGHRWADISEGGAASAGGYGVALLNDCKYGYDIHANIMRLSLLRSPIEPDPDADRGTHAFTYALYPHAGGLAEGGVVEQAQDLNTPIRVCNGRPADGDAASASWFRVDRPGLVIDTVKVAEDGNGVIVRLYEAYGTRGRATLTVPEVFKHAVQTNMLERPTAQPQPINGQVAFDVRPFQVVTLCLSRG